MWALEIHPTHLFHQSGDLSCVSALGLATCLAALHVLQEGVGPPILK